MDFEKKQFLDYLGLATYDELIKKLIQEGNDNIQAQIDAIVGDTDADLGEISAALNEVIDKLGAPSEGDEPATGLFADVENNTEDIASIKDVIGTPSVEKDEAAGVEAQEATGLVARIESLEEDVAVNTSDIAANADEINDIKDILGHDKVDTGSLVVPAEGLVKDVRDVQATLAELVGEGEKSIDSKIDSAVDEAIKALVDGAPEALDTLKEIADWIAEDETGTEALIKRVSDNEEAIENMVKEHEEHVKYIDDQDLKVYNSIQSIEKLKIVALFPAVQDADESFEDALASIEEGSALVMLPDQTIANDVVIDKSCYIDAKGSVFEGTVSIPADVDVIIENATFAKPVVVG